MSPLAPPRVVARACLAAARATRFGAKLNEHFDDQLRVVHGDLGNELGIIYAQEFFVEIFVVHACKIASCRRGGQGC